MVTGAQSGAQGLGGPTHPGLPGTFPVLAQEVPGKLGWAVLLLREDGQSPCGMFPFVIRIEW